MTFNESLFAELRDDPAALGYAPLIAARNDEGVSALYNAATLPVLGKIVRDDLLSWVTDTDMHGVIVDIAADRAHELRSSALSILAVMIGRSQEDGIDLAKGGNANTLGRWLQLSVLSEEHKDSFIAYATRNIARPIVQLGRLTTANDIARVVRDAAGNSLLGA